MLFFSVSFLALHAAPPDAANRPQAQLARPTASPLPRPGGQRIQRTRWNADVTATPPRILTTLTLGSGQSPPTFRWLGQAEVRRQNLNFMPQRLQYTGPKLPLLPAPVITPTAGLVDHWVDQWSPLLQEDLTDPLANCIAFDAQANQLHGGWQPISDGAGQPYALQPAVAPQRDSWLVCGPFASSGVSHLLAQFTYRLGIDQASHDRFFFGVSGNGQDFQGVAISGFTADWLTQQVDVGDITSEHLWLAWAFTGADATANSTGLGLADLQAWAYRTPSQVCGHQTQSNKGVVLPAYDPTTNPSVPMIRAGDVSAARNLQTAGVRWVRLGFQLAGDALDLLAYDRMVDTLCAHGISVLGLLNQEMLAREDYRSLDEEQFALYRQEFGALAHFLAGHFAHRIGAWEIWNEPNLSEGAYLDPMRYAHLLQQSHQAIKRANPHAQVIFGGLASAWADSHAYLAAVYAEWNKALGSVRPFDHLALHPYPRKREGPNPAIFFTAEPEQPTILDKFLQLMAEQGDGNKTLWITEVGFNSAKRSANRPLCLHNVLVDESEQAAYATATLDILFNQVSLWGQPAAPAVEKVFWYQYMDVGTTDPCRAGAMPGARPHADWWFGLYRGDKSSPKPVWCAFAAYPFPCGTSTVLYLPFLARSP